MLTTIQMLVVLMQMDGHSIMTVQFTQPGMCEPLKQAAYDQAANDSEATSPVVATCTNSTARVDKIAADLKCEPFEARENFVNYTCKK